MKTIVITMLKAYKYFVSPVLEFMFGKACKYQVTCSEYAIHTISKDGVLVGTPIALKRFLSCNNFRLAK